MIDVHMEVCGCMELNTFLYSETKPLPETYFCTPRQAFECAKLKANVSSMLDKCFSIDTCPERCEYWRHEASLSSSPLVRKQLEASLGTYRKSNQTSDDCIYAKFFTWMF